MTLLPRSSLDMRNLSHSQSSQWCLAVNNSATASTALYQHSDHTDKQHQEQWPSHNPGGSHTTQLLLHSFEKKTTQLITYRFLSVNTEQSLTRIAHIPTLLESGKDSALMIHTFYFRLVPKLGYKASIYNLLPNWIWAFNHSISAVTISREFCYKIGLQSNLS